MRTGSGSGRFSFSVHHNVGTLKDIDGRTPIVLSQCRRNLSEF